MDAPWMQANPVNARMQEKLAASKNVLNRPSAKKKS